MRIVNYVSAVFVSLLSSSTFAVQQYMLVQCSNIEIQSVHSDPDTGESKREKTCALSLAAVPNNYTLISTAAAGNGEVKYLFSRT